MQVRNLGKSSRWYLNHRAREKRMFYLNKSSSGLPWIPLILSLNICAFNLSAVCPALCQCPTGDERPLPSRKFLPPSLLLHLWPKVNQRSLVAWSWGPSQTLPTGSNVEGAGERQGAVGGNETLRGGGEKRAGDKKIFSSTALATRSLPSALVSLVSSIFSHLAPVQGLLLWLWSLFLESFPPDIHRAHFLTSSSFLMLSKILLMEKLPWPYHR